jgi:hypothetical protein
MVDLTGQLSNFWVELRELLWSGDRFSPLGHEPDGRLEGERAARG